MHYKLKCFESRGETLCDSSPVLPSESNPANTIYCILHIASPPCAMSVKVLVPSPAQELGLQPGAGCCSTCFPTSQASTASSLAPRDAVNARRSSGRAWILVKDKAHSYPKHHDAPSAIPQSGSSPSEVGRELGRDKGVMLSILSTLMLSWPQLQVSFAIAEGLGDGAMLC